MARERYDNVLTRVAVGDRRGVTRFVRSRANQRRDRECKNNPPHDVPPFFTHPRSSPWLILIIDVGSALTVGVTDYKAVGCFPRLTIRCAASLSQERRLL